MIDMRPTTDSQGVIFDVRQSDVPKLEKFYNTLKKKEKDDLKFSIERAKELPPIKEYSSDYRRGGRRSMYQRGGRGGF